MAWCGKLRTKFVLSILKYFSVRQSAVIFIRVGENGISNQLFISWPCNITETRMYTGFSSVYD